MTADRHNSPRYRPKASRASGTNAWLEVLKAAQAEDLRDTAAGLASRTRELALLRGALLDLLATGDTSRVTSALTWG